MKNRRLAWLCCAWIGLAGCEEDFSPEKDEADAGDASAEATADVGADSGFVGSSLDASTIAKSNAYDGGADAGAPHDSSSAAVDAGAADGLSALPALVEGLFSDGGPLSTLPDPTTLLDELTGQPTDAGAAASP